jgi:hypothetical protein
MRVGGNKTFLVLACLLVAGSAWGFARLFLMRFQSGDIYPPYSSLRADPLGTRVLFESLAKMPNLWVQRNFKRMEKLPREVSTLLLPGVWTCGLFAMNFDTSREIQAFAARGGRVIVSLTAVQGAQKSDEDAEKSDRANSFKPVRWDFEVAYETGAVSLLSASLEKNGTPASSFLPSPIFWHGQVYFKSLSNGWRTIYQRNEHPVVIERTFGAGCVVMMADSYLLSNEALWRHREPALLSWLIGPSSRIVFDETHFGLREQPGIGALIRKYRLYGFAAGFLLLAALFVWKESSAFVPPPASQELWGERVWIAGRDSMSGLVNLLRRNISPRDLLRVCASQWEKVSSATQPGRIEALKKAKVLLEREAALPGKDQDIVRIYREIGRILKQRK